MVFVSFFLCGMRWGAKAKFGGQLPSRLVAMVDYAQNPLDTFPRNFPVDGEVANLLRTCYGGN